MQSSKRSRTECALNASDVSSIELSTDPSQNDYNAKCHYKPVTRDEWIAGVPPKKPKMCDPDPSRNDTVDRDPVQKPTTPEDLLNELMGLVRARDGKLTAMRKVVRELRSTLRWQRKKLTQDCPVGKVDDETRAWCTGASGACSECGMNHFGVALHRLGHQLYGTTTDERNKRFTQWLKDGTGEYVRTIRTAIKDSWLGQLLADITVKREVQKVEHRRFIAVSKNQVRHRTTHTLSHGVM